MCKSLLSFLLFLMIPFISYAEDIPLLTGQLSNGLTYYIHHDPQAKSQVLLDFIVKASPLEEKDEERGFSQLLMRYIESTMYFKGKKIIDPRCAIWDLTLPDNDTLTSYAFTQYHFEISRAIPGGLEEGLLGFSNMLSLASLDDKVLQDVKNDVLEEISESEESPMETWKRARASFESFHFYKHPLENSASSLSQAYLEKVYPFYRKHYQPGRMAVIVIGNVSLEQTKELIENSFGNIPGSKDSDMPKNDLGLGSYGTLSIRDKRLRDTFLSLSKPLPKMSQRETLMLSICTQMLSQYLRGFAAKAKFSQPLLELSTYPRMLRLTVSLPENVEKEARRLYEALQCFFNQRVTEEQVDAIKAEIRKNLIFLRKKGKDISLGEFYRDHFILNDRSLETDHPYLRTELLDTIHAEDINQMLPLIEGFSSVSLGSNRKYSDDTFELLTQLFRQDRARL